MPPREEASPKLLNALNICLHHAAKRQGGHQARVVLPVVQGGNGRVPQVPLLVFWGRPRMPPIEEAGLRPRLRQWLHPRPLRVRTLRYNGAGERKVCCQWCECAYTRGGVPALSLIHI